MNRTRIDSTASEREFRILNNELLLARMTIIRLIPEPMQSIVRGWKECRTRSELYRWQDTAVAKIIMHAKILDSGRAYCPLCRDGVQSHYNDGFSVPEGMRRHLVGYGQVRECGVMETAMKVALTSLNERFMAHEESDLVTKISKDEQRKTTETLFRIHPFDPPELIDARGNVSNYRNDKELEFAENRLAELGFTFAQDKNIKSYIRESDHYVVYADIRTKKSISFEVIPKPIKAPIPNKPRFGRRFFTLPDAWVNDLKMKFDSWLEEPVDGVAFIKKT